MTKRGLFANVSWLNSSKSPKGLGFSSERMSRMSSEVGMGLDLVGVLSSWEGSMEDNKKWSDKDKLIN